MAYNEKLADRVRTALVHQKAVEEKKMMGGLTFMVDVPRFTYQDMFHVLHHVKYLKNWHFSYKEPIIRSKILSNLGGNHGFW